MEFENEDIDRRIEISAAVGEYIRAIERSKEAEASMEKASKRLHGSLEIGQRVVVNANYRNYLVTRSDECSVSLSPIEVIPY